ncbi:hypothetical protein ACOMHN_007019 [Nucella lapillus]
MVTMDECLNRSSSFPNISFMDVEEEGNTDEEDTYLRYLALQVDRYIMKRGIPVISGFGLVGNFLALLVLTKEKLCKSLTKMEISANTGLIGLAVSDLMFCLMVLLISVLPLKPYYSPGEVMVYFDVSLGGCITVFIVTSTCLIVVMAAERYVAVCHPLKARRFISLKRTRTYVILLFVLCPLFTLPVFREKYINRVTCVDGSTLYTVETVPRDSVVVRRIVWAICFDFVPCAALIYFNACLIWKIHKTKQLRKKMTPLRTSYTQNTDKNKMRRCVRWDNNPTQNFRIQRRNADKESHGFIQVKTQADCFQNTCDQKYQAGDTSFRPAVIMTSRVHKKNLQQDDKRFLTKIRKHFDHEKGSNSQSGVSRANGHKFRGDCAGEESRRFGAGVDSDQGGTLLGDTFRSTDPTSTNSGRSVGAPSRSLLQEERENNRSMSPHFFGSTGGEQKIRSTSSSSNSKHRYSDTALNSVTATLVAVILTFLLLVSPWELLKFFMLASSSPMDATKMGIVHTLTNFMQVMNFSFNFVLYCLVNKSFRSSLRQIICCQPSSPRLARRAL